jgi:hypothetical protein
MNAETPTPRRDGGYVVAFTALLMLPILAFVGFAVDLGSWYAQASSIQAASDAAALAGVTYLPNFTTARAEALEVASRNGFTNGVDGVTVTVERVGNAQIRVDIHDPEIEQFFTTLFTDDVEIERGGTAEYITPVPMGSPRNYLGANTLPAGTNADDNFWLSASGYCARREMGDRITAFSDANGSTFQNCTPPTSSTVANSEYSADGYFYVIELDDGDDIGSEAWPYTPRVDLYDAAHCEGATSGGTNMGTDAGDSGTNDISSNSGHQASGERRYRFTLRDNDSQDPRTASILTQVTLGPTTNCAPNGGNSWVEGWRALSSISGATEGKYYLQVQPLQPTDRTGTDAQEGQNQFAVRVWNTGWGSAWSCTSEAAEAVSNAPVRLNGDGTNRCPAVYGLSHLGIYANVSSTNPVFYLASVGNQYAGRTMQVEMFDPAEGALGIEILDPNGDPVEFEWEFGCQDGSFNDGASCPGENNPITPPGRGPATNDYLDVCVTPTASPACTVGTGSRPYGSRNSQNGTYSDRLVRLSFELPTLAENPTWYGGDTWFKVRYTVGSSGVGDRTTWSVNVLGDPVRLVE